MLARNDKFVLNYMPAFHKLKSKPNSFSIEACTTSQASFIGAANSDLAGKHFCSKERRRGRSDQPNVSCIDISRLTLRRLWSMRYKIIFHITVTFFTVKVASLYVLHQFSKQAD